jgi:hypothetical protein
VPFPGKAAAWKAKSSKQFFIIAQNSGNCKGKLRGVSGLLGSSQRPIAQIPLSHPNGNSKCQNSNVK